MTTDPRHLAALYERNIPDDIADLTVAHVTAEAALARELFDVHGDNEAAEGVERRLAWAVLRAIAAGHPDAAGLAKAAL